MLSGRNENGINYYTARKLKDMSQSLEQLAKAFDDGAGETGSAWLNCNKSKDLKGNAPCLWGEIQVY